MYKKCYKVYKVKAKHLIKDDCKWVVYKWEGSRYGIQPTYYKNKKEAHKGRYWALG